MSRSLCLSLNNFILLPVCCSRAESETQQGLSVNTENLEVSVTPERPRSQTSDSDSDGPILYRDDDEEEDDEYLNSALSSSLLHKA